MNQELLSLISNTVPIEEKPPKRSFSTSVAKKIDLILNEIQKISTELTVSVIDYEH